MSSELIAIRKDIKSLIINTCNKIGCNDCTMKWEADENGDKCRSDYLMTREMQIKKKNGA